MRSALFLAAVLLIMNVTGCVTYAPSVMDSPGRPTVYEDTGSPGALAGVGVESQDIVGMTDRMMRDMLASPALAGSGIPPRVIIDDNNFYNESSSIINKRMITERLMVNLNRAAAGRLVFIERQAAAMVEQERALKRQGVVSDGTLGRASMTAGADFSLTGRIMSQSSVSNSTGMASRYHQISFKMVDLETGVAVWTGLYEFKKTAQDDIVYR
jgi:PBP1b-binding outer membrane lipoprotein LpoB